MGVLKIPLLNPLRFIMPDADQRFDRLPAFEQINSFQREECYLQKWQIEDDTVLQVLSDFEFTFKVYDRGGAEVLDIIPVLKTVNIIGQTFSVYEVPINFGALPEGAYVAEITYINDDTVEVTLQSEPFAVAEEWENTMLFEYKNSENDFSIVFDTGVEFDIRVEGVITDFRPQSDALVYNDQRRNATLLNSIPWREFTLFVGNAMGVPDWMADKINRVMSCDQVKIDGDYYERTEGSEFEENRADEYPWLGLTLPIMPVENRFDKFITGNDPQDVTIVQKYKNYTDVSGNLVIGNTFKDWSLLEKIVIVLAPGALLFDLTVGITDGGDEIGTFQVDNDAMVFTIEHRFTEPANLFLGGITELESLSVIYKQLDEPPIPIGLGGGQQPSTTIGVGFTAYYNELSPGQLDADFNVTTGLGRSGTAYEGWAISDGRNGTEDARDRFIVGSGSAYDMHEIGGESEVTLTIAELPEHSHTTEFVRTKRGSGSDQDHALGAPDGSPFGPQPAVYNSQNAGSNEAHENKPPFLALLVITKIA